MTDFLPDPNRPFKSLRLALGAYQQLTLVATDLGEQISNSGKEPLVLAGSLTTAIDEKFVNKTVSFILTEQAQRDIIDILSFNLNNSVNAIKDLIDEREYSEINI